MFRYPLVLLCTILLVLQHVEGITFQPRNERSMPARRQNAVCEPAVLGVSEDAIIRDACNQNPQNSQSVCYNQLVVYIQQSATNVCAHYYSTYYDCLALNNDNVTACLDQKLGYLDCSNYTLQAYAYCGCYYSLPTDMYTCANVELNTRPSASPITSSLPTASNLPTLTGPVTTPGQSFLTFFPGPSSSTSSTSGGTQAPSSDSTTPTFSPLSSIPDIISSPTIVRPLSSTSSVANATVPLVPVSSAASNFGGAGSRVAIQTTRIGVCVMKKRTRILKGSEQ